MLLGWRRVSEGLSCPSCGAVVELRQEELSRRCAFCETPLVRAELGEALIVDGVVPFSLDRRVAATRLGQFLGQQRWAPDAVRRGARPEALSAVLVPFYAYDAITRSTWAAQLGLWWYRTVSTTVSVNGRAQSRTRQQRETEWFPVSGTHVHTYAGHLVSGSRGLPEREANALEPYDLAAAQPGAAERLAGLTAERPTIPREEARRTAADELAKRENSEIRAFLPGDEVGQVDNQTSVTVESVRLMLLPVWIATYRHQGAVFRLLVNGQTGEVVGQVPRSNAKIALAVALALLLALSCAGCLGLLTLAGGGR